MPAVALALLLFAVLPAAAKGADSDCIATAVYPDGTEIERECIVDGAGKKGGGGAKSTKGGSSEHAWLKDTRWNWNDWRDVILKSDGSFLAPAEGCEREGNPRCTWSTAGESTLYVNFGGAGRHTLTLNDDQQSFFGARDRDGDEVHASLRM